VKALYDSPWHHPFLCWVAHALFFVALLVRKGDVPFYRRFFWLFGLEIVSDALLTGGWTPLRGPSLAATIFPVVFVILGDLRYFLLVEYVLAGRFSPGVVGRALGLSVVIPIATAPLVSGDSRLLFLVYEAAFVVLALLLRFVIVPRRAAKLPAEVGAFLALLSGFEIVQYLGWAIADTRILAGDDLGHLMRIVPNLLYYAGFLWFAWLAMPKVLRERAA
jgi:hypothetical protein